MTLNRIINSQTSPRVPRQVEMLKNGAELHSAILGATVWLSPQFGEFKFGSDAYGSDEVQGKNGPEKAWTVLSQADDWQIANETE